MRPRSETGHSTVRDDYDRWVKNATTENFNKLKYRNSKMLENEGKFGATRQLTGTTTSNRKNFSSPSSNRHLHEGSGSGSGPMPLIFSVIIVIIMYKILS